jgi:hypothetical protein
LESDEVEVPAAVPNIDEGHGAVIDDDRESGSSDIAAEPITRIDEATCDPSHLLLPEQRLPPPVYEAIGPLELSALRVN